MAAIKQVLREVCPVSLAKTKICAVDARLKSTAFTFFQWFPDDFELVLVFSMDFAVRSIQT